MQVKSPLLDWTKADGLQIVIQTDIVFELLGHDASDEAEGFVAVQ
jgi:hypothetical protein